MTTASVLLVFLRDSWHDWAETHHLERYANVLHWAPRRSSHFWT